jgi:predicted lactoylglutathione lyase
MEPKLIWANLVSTDLDRTTQFYTALGFKSNGKYKTEGTSFIFGESKFVINFFIPERLSKEVNGNLAIPKENEIIFSLSAETKKEVDD